MGRFTSRKAIHRPARNRTIVAVVTGFVLLIAVPVFADSPNPRTGTATMVVNPNGTTTVTLSGTWSWTKATSCTKATGYNVDWNDPLQPGNLVGTLNGVSYEVGALAANVLNPADNVIHPMANCVETAGIAGGNWGPISHTYAAGSVLPATVCAVTYHNKGGVAGGPGHQTDNSVEENDNSPGSAGCISLPKTPNISTLSNPNSTGVAPGAPATDTATVSGSAGSPTGTVTFFLCGPAQVTAAGCPAGGSQIGSPVTLVGGVATSTTTNATSAEGRYCWRAAYSGDSIYTAGTHTNNTTECFTVAKLVPVIATTASGNGTSQTPGFAATDSVTVTGSGGTPTGTVTFYLCDPSSSSASGCAAGTQVGSPVTLVNGMATSASSTATSSPGMYCWRVSYSGDNVYAPGSHTNGTSECFNVSKLTPTVATTASATGTDIDPGTSVTDTATVSGTAGTPTGTVTFFLCTPSQTTASGCSGGSQVGSPVALVNGTATSAATTSTTATGLYCWRVSYSGDSVYASATHTNNSSECFNVVEQPPSLLDPTVNTVSNPTGDGVAPGSSAQDTATVAGPLGGVAPTGTVKFFICTPAQSTSAGCPTGGTQVGSAVTLSAGGQATSSSFSSTMTIGRYCWRAEYSGDVNYNPATHTNNTSECFSTAKATPVITTVPKPDRASLTNTVTRVLLFDTAQVTGGVSPTGTVTFKLFGPNDSDCSGPAIFKDVAPLVGGKAVSDQVAVSERGMYRWIATYSGDAHNASATHGCQVEKVAIDKVLPACIGSAPGCLPATGLDAKSLRNFGFLLLGLAVLISPALLRSRRVRTITNKRGVSW
jgi:hypothetical protein